MIREGINGFCMALADSVPGVSGGTVAFIMGFYDQFIGSIDRLAFGKREEKKNAIQYLMKLMIGWAIGMILAVIILSSLFENNIYIVSSVFIGFIAGAIPIIIQEEKDSFKEVGKGIAFLILGIVLVAGITWFHGRNAAVAMNLAQFSTALGIRLFLIGMIAISAMFLPGISGSTLLLIFGAYIPVITAVKDVLTFDFSCIPSLMCFGFGILAGAVGVVRAIKVCLEKYRTQMIYFILGMMVGSFYAIIMGPTTLEVPQAAMTLETFHVPLGILGVALVLGMQKMKEHHTQEI